MIWAANTICVFAETDCEQHAGGEYRVGKLLFDAGAAVIWPPIQCQKQLIATPHTTKPNMFVSGGGGEGL